MDLYYIITFIISICSVRTDDVVIRTIKSAGYHAELHSVITEDAYILNVHRIRSPHPTAKVVLMMHGLLANSFLFVLHRNQLAFELANNGYDVWFGNARGNEFARKHQSLHPNYAKFWDFSFHEIGVYDLPSIIDHILAATNRSTLHYVGHSQGTTAVVALLASRPEYNHKMLTLHLITPVVFIRNMSPLWLRTFGPIIDAAETVDAMGHVNEIFTLGNELRKILAKMCNSKTPLTYNVCKIAYTTVMGHSILWNDKLFVNTTEIFQHIPNSISLRQILHYAQLFKYGKFKQYHYNREKNLLLYNRTEPPEYNLKNVRAKIHILYGTTDNVDNFKDVEALIEIFRPLIIGIDKMVGWNHMDFIVAQDLGAINKKIMKLMKQHS